MFLLEILLAVPFVSGPVRIAPAAAGIEYKQPQVAVAPGLVALTFGAGEAVYFAASRDGGESFSAPVEVARQQKPALGRHRGPRIAVGGRAIVISAIGGSGDLAAWRSTDGGNTWSPRVVVNDVASSAREGLHAMAAGGGSLVFAAWLDSRDRGNQIYGAVSTNGGATWSKNRLIYASPAGHTCECCHPSVFVSGPRVYVMWRNWLEGARDMYLARSEDGGQTFSRAEKLGRGTWPLNACPMDGGGIAADSSGAVVSIWRRGNEVFLARPGAAEEKLGTGKDPSVALASDGVYAAWTAGSGVVAKLPGAAEPVPLAETGGYAQLAGSGPVIAAWESGGAIFLQRLGGGSGRGQPSAGGR